MSPDETFVRKLLLALKKVRLEAIIVGTGAAALQGAPILTQDIDLLIRDTGRNRTKLQELCTLMHGALMEISPLARGLRIVGTEINVDVLFDELPGGLRFESIRSRGVQVSLGGEAVAVAAHLSDVIASKEAADRPKDRAQLPILRDTLRVRMAFDATSPPRRRRRRR